MMTDDELGGNVSPRRGLLDRERERERTGLTKRKILFYKFFFGLIKIFEYLL